MTSKEAAQIYVDLVRLEESLDPDQLQVREEIMALRSKYHDLFTQTLREMDIECADRFEATRRAFELVREREYYQTARGKEYEWIVVRPWSQVPQVLMWSSWIVVTPRPELSRTQNVSVCINMSSLLLAQLNEEIQDIPEKLTQLSIQLILERGLALSGTMKLHFTEEGLEQGEENNTEVLVSWRTREISISTITNDLNEVLSNVREQSQQIGFHKR